ncbi:MAG: class I SAM-dependent methyltransferase [Lentisphaeria bacterium]|nr:class I SAM-dependent methyltransferase [Lentisphaeria bacterium]
MIKKITVRKGREKSLKLRHPWVFSGSLDLHGVERCAWAELVDCNGNFLAYATVNPDSKIACRVWSFDPADTPDREFFRKKIASALRFREKCNFAIDNVHGVRLINSEGDGLPGVIADDYAGVIVVQFLTAGAVEFKNIIAGLLFEMVPGAAAVYEKSDSAVLAKENLPVSDGLMLGKLPEKCVIEENGAKFEIDFVNGHKSGFYLDQRRNRDILSRYVRGRTVLNCFSYTGGFGVKAALGGAEFVTNVDSSAPALAQGAENMKLNGIDSSRFEDVEGDVFSLLRKFRAEKRKFDFIILDPPKLVQSRGDLNRAAKAYKDMALVALHILNEGGMLANFSCSGLMPRELFQKITFDAALDAGRTLRMVEFLEQDADHAWSLNVPESFYLKGHLMMAD